MHYPALFVHRCERVNVHSVPHMFSKFLDRVVRSHRLLKRLDAFTRRQLVDLDQTPRSTFRCGPHVILSSVKSFSSTLFFYHMCVLVGMLRPLLQLATHTWTTQDMHDELDGLQVCSPVLPLSVSQLATCNTNRTPRMVTTGELLPIDSLRTY